MSLHEDLTALAKLRRSRANLERVQVQLGELRELADDAEDVLSALASAREKLGELGDTLTVDDNPLMEWVPDLREALEGFQDSLPSDDLDAIGELIGEAEGYAEEYENCLDDSDYSADDREEVWGNLLDALESIAEAVK